MAVQGCLFGYGPSQPELRRRAADYLARIFRGAVPGDLPIEGPTRFELTVSWPLPVLALPGRADQGRIRLLIGGQADVPTVSAK
jgi:hypothetical protein